MIASYNWWKINTVILRECYHDTMQTLLWKYYEYVSTKVLKIAMEKKTTSKKEGIIRLQSDLRFLINTYEGLSFQWSFFPREDHTTHRNMKSLILIYIFEESSYKFIVFFTIIHVPKQTILVFYVIRRNSNLKQQCNKVKKRFLIGWPYVQYFRFQTYGHHLTYSI